MGRLAVIIILILATNGCLHAQFNPNHDGNKGWTRQNATRSDQIFHPESAMTEYAHSGNVSLFTESRFGLTNRIELSTHLAFNVFQPNIKAKIRWNTHFKNWIIASKINLGNAYPGLSIAKRNFNDIVAADAVIPVVVEAGHELIASRVFKHDANCSDGNEWLVLTGSIGTYLGMRFKKGDVEMIPKHFLYNRSTVLVRSNFLASMKLWADWKALRRLHVHGGFRLQSWQAKKNIAFEAQAEAEMFLNVSCSIHAGCALSAANYKTTSNRIGVLPIIDFTYYIGKEKKQEKTLFNPNGHLY